MEPIPNDLILEIFSRLPAKSVIGFRTLSKHWASMLRSPVFTELFLTRSSNRPRLLFAAERNGEWLFFSSPQPQNRYEKSSHLDYHTKFSGDVSRFICSYVSGLLCFPDLWLSKDASPVICNPTTGMYESLPDLMRYKNARGFLGFDPIGKQFKVLSEAYPFSDQREHHEILTLGTEELSWRSNIISCPAYDRSLSEGICINGVLYYLAQTLGVPSCVIICFDVRSEEFKYFDAGCFNDQLDDTSGLILVNYEGKLSGINWKYGQAGERRTVELRMWVLEDAEKHEWVKYVYTLPENEVLDSCDFSVAGVTTRGDIVLCMKYTCKPFYVFYFNPERNTLQSVEIQDFGANLEAVENCGRVYAFVNHVEDLRVNKGKQLKSSISQVKHLCSCCNKVSQPDYHYQKA
ncbi:F-box and associated interaction domains-containing protein [Arabidopsis thaliana]|uniref:F-box and associated interaction domains-containing protein n=1 Tax=Arabidopsis thaliana TaxID=3702 RepID=UPI0001A7B0A7|nr:F-box and associated interaction domains-containing protein [Arabidopsis thaliana]AEE79676.1 F-box and associated interaction domains-containing protein [Arabidopsis thaliana]|eukprot:NP_191318.4 F-box and associated interaction domains-containing protein [Arabidopsis thaliana]